MGVASLFILILPQWHSASQVIHSCGNSLLCRNRQTTVSDKHPHQTGK